MSMPSTAQIVDTPASHAALAAGMLSAFNLSDEEIQILYHDGVRMYQSARYEQAKAFLSLACMFRPSCHDYLYAWAMAMKMAGEYEQALLVFPLAALYAPSGFKPLLHAAECLLHLQRKSEAAELLYKLLRDAGNEVDANLLERAHTWLQLVESGDRNASGSQ